MKCKIINKTQWNTKQIKSLIANCLKYRGWDNDRQHTTKIIYQKSSSFSEIGGWAYVNGNYITMQVSRSEFNAEKFCQVFLHELDHNLGLRHREMNWSSNLDIPDIKNITVEQELPKAAFVVPLIEKAKTKYQRIVLKIDEKQRTINRLQKAIKKLENKKNYYIRKYNF